MDDAERIPIAVGYEVAAEAPAVDPRTTVRPDGTIVIDILAPQPCVPSGEDEIVVCAEAEDGSRYLPPPPPPPPGPTAMEKLQDALTVKIGLVEIGPGGPDGAAGFSARVKF